jgi:hypothetical protein
MVDANAAIVALKPIQKLLVMDVLREAGVGVSHWAENFKGRYPSANPKYCYNWSFEQPGELVALCLWHNSLEVSGGNVVFRREPKAYATKASVPGAIQWNERDAQFARGLETAYRQQLPIRVIVVDGKRRGATDPNPKASKVEARLLDPVSWAVTQFDEATGRCVLVRGIQPESPASASPDAELSWFEGKQRAAFILHRHREEKARRAKIADAKSRNGGRLICEVPSCGFDFSWRYGALGEGYAQVHHLVPLNKSSKTGRETKLEDLAIVCANCHVMIHKGGECRSLVSLIP